MCCNLWSNIMDNEDLRAAGGCVDRAERLRVSVFRMKDGLAWRRAGDLQATDEWCKAARVPSFRRVQEGFGLRARAGQLRQPWQW
jgi:hypothetical protein